MALRNVVYLENSMLDAMLADPTMRDEFAACLRYVASAPREGGCPKCRKEGRRPQSAYESAKDCIIGLPQPAKDRLKQLLNARQIRALVRGGKEFTF